MEAEQSKSRVLHVLRSVMLAGAGAVVWIALSSTAANADSGSTNNHTLLGGAVSAVSNVVHNAAKGLSGIPGNTVSVTVVQVPTVSELPQLTRSVDQLVASTPVVGAVLPEGTVGAVTTNVVSPAASAVDGVGSSVGSLVGSLPVATPEITVPSIQIPDGVALAGGPAVVEPVAGVPSTLAQDVAAPMLSLAVPSGPPGLHGAPLKATVRASGSNDPSAPPSGGTFPPGTPGGSDTVSGSAVLSSNPSGAATAWLQGTNLFCPLTGTLVSTAAAGRVPAPVSFDPGSSPD
ncbi:hypothetical protein [Arthrobacter ramosus]|uniref:Uncharacterized protein n=1 Tax=Arthrobacter ramosus TaxID=1672 RepID=A0ABV5Y103_ARTRM|nr:hypothetical protein [Arthrobacter ramosus]